MEEFDVVIIGGGFAGISCSLELHDNYVKHIIVEKNHSLGGQISLIANRIRNLPGTIFENGKDLESSLERTSSELLLPISRNEELVEIDLSKKIMKTSKTTMRSKAIVLATGARRCELQFEDENELSKKVFYMVEGKEDQLQGKRVVVVGGGDSALIEALWLAKYSKQVALVHRKKEFHARPDLINDIHKQKNIVVYLESKVEGLKGTAEIESVLVKNLRTEKSENIFCEAVVAKIGQIPNNQLFIGQVKMDSRGHILINEYMETSNSGVYAIGDLASPPYWRLAVASGQGSVAARSVMNHLWNQQL